LTNNNEKGKKMFELHFEGRVQGRGSKQAMREMRQQLSAFSGIELYRYKIVEV